MNAAAHQLLWRHYMASGKPGVGDAVIGSLRAICRSGLVDHVGGGVHRYCADDAWRVPHFEKMLYDNAQLLELLTWVWRQCRCPELRRCAEGIATWAAAEMRVPGCGFAGSLGADDPTTGEEGAFYLWNESALAEALDDDAGFLLSLYALSPLDENPGGVLMPRDDRVAGLDDAARLASCMTRLATARAARRRPLRDGKVMADWNGLMLVALIEAGNVFGRRDWLALARDVFDEIVASLADGATLHHSITDGRLGPAGLLRRLRDDEPRGDPPVRGIRQAALSRTGRDLGRDARRRVLGRARQRLSHEWGGRLLYRRPSGRPSRMRRCRPATR